MKPCETYQKTHSNCDVAFPKHCDYACAVSHYKPRPYGKWLFWTIVVLSVVAVIVQIGLTK